jgi:hypothetical protein
MRRTSARLAGLVALIVIVGWVAASPAAATTTIANRTIKNLRISAGRHDIVYDHVTFTGGSATSAVVTISQSAYNITFRYCTIATGGGWNGVSINDNLGKIHNITFDHVAFKAQKRMGIEITSRPVSTTQGYHHINITSSIFEPQGSEAVSYDGGAGAKDCTFAYNTVKGAGTNLTQQWGAALEINGPSNFIVKSNRFYQARGALWNLQRHVSTPSGWVFSGNILDASHHVQKVAMKSNAQVVSTINVYGGVFARNMITADAPGGGVAWLGDSHDMDWRTSTWVDPRGSGYRRPMQASCSGNLF